MKTQNPRDKTVAAMLTRAIRLTITWQCYMVVNPAVRHSDTEPVKHRRYELLYTDYENTKIDVTQSQL